MKYSKLPQLILHISNLVQILNFTISLYTKKCVLFKWVFQWRGCSQNYTQTRDIYKCVPIKIGTVYAEQIWGSVE